MYQVILYFVLNFAGFLVFLAIWNRIPKPKPLDYTTIPGMKLNVDTAEDIPEMELKPGTRTDPSFGGNFDEVRKFPTLQSLLQFLSFKYGPLNSFWWSNRYIVTVSGESFMPELKKYRANLLAVSPFAIGSYLLADSKYCTTVEYDTINLKRNVHVKPDLQLDEKVQHGKLIRCDNSEEKGGSSETALVSQIISNLRQVENIYTSRNPSDLRKKLNRPLMVVYNEEIWVDAHPIPKYIPIIIHTESIISDWHDDELFPKFYAMFYWLPGFHNLHDVI